MYQRHIMNVCSSVNSELKSSLPLFLADLSLVMAYVLSWEGASGTEPGSRDSLELCSYVSYNFAAAWREVERAMMHGHRGMESLPHEAKVESLR